MIQFSNFQTSYPLVPLEELLESYIGGDWGIAPEKNHTEYVNVKCIRATELKNWSTEKAQTAAPRKIKKASLVKRNLLEGDIVLEISGGGPEQPVGRVEVITKEVISSNHGENLVCTNFFRMLRPNNQVIPKFLKLYLDFFYLCGPIQELQSGSNNLRNLKFNDYLKIEVPLPDIERQHSIIQSIEIAIGHIDSGVDALCLAEKQLELYRQSVLKDAFEGKLTADWRAANPDIVEPADKLLARIEAERKATHQAELDAWKDAVNQWEANGKDGKKPSKPKADTSNKTIHNELLINRQLPDAWATATIGQISSVGTGATPLKSEPKFYNEGNIPWVTSSSVNEDPITISENFITEFALLNTNVSLYPSGTLLMAMYGEGKTRGKVGELSFPSTTNQAIAAINFLENHKTIKSFVKNFLKFNYEKNRTVSVGGVQPNLNLAKVKAIEVPICGASEMEHIIKAVEDLSHEISEMVRVIERQKKAAELLKQSILKQAFSGHELLEDVS